MIGDYCICLNPVCVIEPKYHILAKDALKHNKNTCDIVSFENIYQNLFDKPNLNYPY